MGSTQALGLRADVRKLVMFAVYPDVPPLGESTHDSLLLNTPPGDLASAARVSTPDRRARRPAAPERRRPRSELRPRRLCHSEPVGGDEQVLRYRLRLCLADPGRWQDPR